MKNIILIGMPSAGKSTIGVVLAKTLGMSFIDTDLVIQENTHKLLQEIINKDGIDEFLKVEEKNIISLQCNGAVVATGGSVVYSNEAMKHLKEDNTTVYLKVSYEEIVRRIDNITSRGIALRKGETLLDMYNKRIPLYDKYSDITIDCSGKNVEETVQAIVEIIDRK